MNFARRIELDALPNTRDLGGYPTKSGKYIQKKRLIRSGELSRATSRDTEILTREYNLKKIIDFRNETERNNKPDVVIDNVEYVFNPIINKKISGISHENDKAPKQQESTGWPDPIPHMADNYSRLVSVETAIQGYKSFFKELLNTPVGSVLWHCSLGKDRAGTATILLLEALDVPRDIILADYLMTAEYIMPIALKMREDAKKESSDPTWPPFAYGTSIVAPEYFYTIYETVNREFGSMKEYLKNEMELGKEEIDTLHNMYLQ